MTHHKFTPYRFRSGVPIVAAESRNQSGRVLDGKIWEGVAG